MTSVRTQSHSVSVFQGDDFRVAVGANLGDGLADMSELQADDIYLLRPGAPLGRVSLWLHDDGRMEISADTEWGVPGATLHLDCAIQLMSPQGRHQVALVLVETDADGGLSGTYLLPLAPVLPDIEYALLSFERDSARAHFAQVGTVSFTRGTHITLSSGIQVPIEELQIGDRVLTRDAGAQPVRWIGHNTVRGTGAFAPVLITAGTLNNSNDLVVSPDHRLFIYQRTDRIGAGKSEILVKARHLVNDDTIRVLDGGFVDYFQLLFDQHHIIFAEGIAAESMLIDPRTRSGVPNDVLQQVGSCHAEAEHGLTVDATLLDRPDLADLLRRASKS